MTGSLKAVAELHKVRPEMKLEGVKKKVEALMSDANAAVAAEAKKTMQLF